MIMDYSVVELAIELANCVVADTLADLEITRKSVKPCTGGALALGIMHDLLERVEGIRPGDTEVKLWLEDITGWQ
jgi:hypothetical protein